MTPGGAAKKKPTTTTSTSTSTSKGKAKKNPKKNELSEEEKAAHAAAKTIQRVYRGHATRIRLEEERRIAAEREAKMTAEMEKLRIAAWHAQLEYDRKQEAKARKKAEEEKKKRREEERLRREILDAAFDCELDDVKNLLDKGADVDCCDVHGNTLLSEAAAGGSAEIVRLVSSRGADPNKLGEFGRSPLWRASFLGKEDVLVPLLESGADPRLPNNDGELPVDVANNDAIRNVLLEWDLSRTVSLKAQLDERRARAALESQERVAAERRSIEETVAAAKEHNDAMQRRLLHAHDELEKRIREHDTCVEEGKGSELIEVTVVQIKNAEQTLDEARAVASRASDELAMSKLALREAQQDTEEGVGESAVTGPSRGITVDIKSLDDILFKDVGARLEKDGRPALVIDRSGRSAVFLQYADTNKVSALSREQTAPNKLRRSILGSIRYGKPFVLDLDNVSSLADRLPALFEDVHPNLLRLIMTRELLKNETYMALCRPEDGEEYEANRFQDDKVARWKFILVSSSKTPFADNFLDGFYVINVKLSQ